MFRRSSCVCVIALWCAMGCSGSSEPGAVDASLADGATLDAPAPADAGRSDAPDAAPTDVPDAAPTDVPDAGPDPSFVVEMTYVTANIGRKYDTRSQVAAVFDHVADVIAPRSGPRLLGWQEIGEGDPCGNCEIELIRDRFGKDQGWATRRPRGTRPNGGSELVKVPVTSIGTGNIATRAVFASSGWAGVSPTRFHTIVYSPLRNVSFLNTHFIAGAWSCKSNVEKRRRFWRRAWQQLRAEVAIEHDKGRNVIVTGDLNRPRGANNCNPAWEPTSFHARAKIIGGQGIDYIFAVPAAGWRFAVSQRSNGSAKRGSINLGIDGHKAHWVAGKFLPR